MSENLGRQHFHRGLFQVCTDEMRTDARSIDLLEKVDRHAQVYVANTFNRKADRVFTGIKYPILTGAVIFEFEQIVAVLKGIYILGLSGVNELFFHGFLSFI